MSSSYGAAGGFVLVLALLVASCDTGGVFLGSDVHASRANVSGAPDASSAAGTGGATSEHGGNGPDQRVDAGDGASGEPTGTGGMSPAVVPPNDAGTTPTDAGTAHADAGATASDAGTVAGGCADGTDDCDGDPSNGCEAALDTDAIHCGTCNNVCPSFGPMSFGSSCMSGHCVLVCEGPYANCDDQPSNGCETLLLGNDVCP